MDLNFFKQTRILDGGMGQELLARGMEPNGTLWSANALLQEKYHQLLLDTHVDFIKAGAEVIVTTTFTTRKMRLKDNNVEDKFEYLNMKAGEIAQKAKKLYPNVLIAGGLPPQYLTYEADMRLEIEIRNDFYSQAKLLNPYIDFFYFDVLSSVREFQIAIDCIKEFNKPYLIGAHISEGTKLPSGENISEITTKIKHKNLINKINLNLIGKIQIKNILMAAIAAQKSNLNFENILKVLPKLKPVEGRLEKIGTIKNNSIVILDYAHTPDALKVCLLNIKEQFPDKKLNLLFGCGGNRDQNKRMKMGKIASIYADNIYLTDDNPRYENPVNIRKDIKKGINTKKITEISNRAIAISKAIKKILKVDMMKSHHGYSYLVHFWFSLLIIATTFTKLRFFGAFGVHDILFVLTLLALITFKQNKIFYNKNI